WPWAHPPTSSTFSLSQPLGLGRVSGLGQLLQEGKELLRLADEQAISRQGVDCPHSRPRRFGWPNDRAGRECAPQEDGRLWHDQIGLQELAGLGEVGKH